MGQRLNIQFVENDEVLCNCYYHWSAYTFEALNLTKIIMENIPKIRCKNKLVYCIKLLEKTGAGLKENDYVNIYEYVKNKRYKFNEAKSREDGWISVSQKEMKDTAFYCSYFINIDLSKKEVVFSVLYDSESTKELLESDSYNNINLKYPYFYYDDKTIRFDRNYLIFDFDSFSKVYDNLMNILEEEQSHYFIPKKIYNKENEKIIYDLIDFIEDNDKNNILSFI